VAFTATGRLSPISLTSGGCFNPFLHQSIRPRPGVTLGWVEPGLPSGVDGRPGLAHGRFVLWGPGTRGSSSAPPARPEQMGGASRFIVVERWGVEVWRRSLERGGEKRPGMYSGGAGGLEPPPRGL